MSSSNDPLVDRIRAKDPVALAQYIDRHRAALLVFVKNKMSSALREKIDAEDIVQEVAASVVQNIEQLEFGDREPFGWLCHVAERRIIDAQRRFASQKRDFRREVGLQGRGRPDASAALVDLLVASITSPSQAFSRQQRQFRMLDAFSQLNEQQQTVLRMRYAEGRPSKEIARQIGKSDGATRVLITRSLKKLEQLLADQPAE